MKTQIILISGKQGSGKTTTGEVVGSMLEGREGNYVKGLTFASTIYEIHDNAIQTLKRKGINRMIKKDGPLLQLLGTEWGRNTLGPDVWVDCLKGDIENLKKESEQYNGTLTVIITDARFKNEFYGLDEGDKILKVRLECDKEIRKARCSMWRENDQHPSEIDLDDIVSEFDLVCDSGTSGVMEIAERIVSAL